MMESIDDAEVPKIISIKVQVSTVEVNLIDFYLKNPSVDNLSKTRTFYFEMRPVRTVQVGVIIVLLVHNTLSQVSYVYLRLYSTGFANVWSTGVDVPSRDKLECAVTCLNETLCQSFSYDKSTMKCSLALGSTLMSVKYVEKLDILKTYVTSSVFIGLDDTVKEGTFIWHDDGTVLNRELMLQIFNSGEPNNSNGKEDCVNYDIGSKLFNDIDCSALRNYRSVNKLTIQTISYSIFSETMGGGGGHAPHEVPDWKIYKAEGIPELDRLQKRLGALGLKDPWI
uniref:Apple domain-containing protein n=1 Tax=Biomphalaria glabrata TaxID=6526 RepID=A0A2C9M6Q8_BIOGL